VYIAPVVVVVYTEFAYTLPEIPAPPVTIKEPVVFELLNIPEDMTTLPDVYTLPEIPAPPVTISDPVVLLVDA
jgi:hypothetical protein